MKTKLAAILAIIAVFCCTLPSRAQQSQQPLKHFGYLGASTDTDLSRVRSYTDFTYVDGEFGQYLIDLATRVRNNGMRVVIDLGKVLWCPDDPNHLYGGYHLCRSYYDEFDYTTQWYSWIAMNSSVLNSNYVLAFSVITEPTIRGIPKADVEAAISLVKQTYPQIPTVIEEPATSIDQNYQVPFNADWIAISNYGLHPNLDAAFKESVRLLKLKKQSWQKTAYTLDAYYEASHVAIAPTVADMDTIAQEWYTIASQDSDAVLLCPFLWPDLPSENAIGSVSFPQNVLDKHAAIGAAILAGRFPTYQGSFDSIDCQSLAGWAWDVSEPNTPISVDIYDNLQKIATIRANQFRQDLLNAGIGNGQHGFSFNLPATLRNGQTHSISIRYSGLDQELGSSPRLACATSPSASIASIKPADSTMTVAGYAQNGAGGVQLVWRDVTINGPWNVVASEPIPNPVDHSWSNTIPSAYRCHTFSAYINYGGVQFPVFTYDGSGYCTESARIIWIQPQPLAGFGPPGSLVVAGSAKNAPSGTQVYLSYRDATLGTGWNDLSFAPVPGSDGIWYNSIPNANFYHQYVVKIKYDVASNGCIYQGNNSATTCP